MRRLGSVGLGVLVVGLVVGALWWSGAVKLKRGTEAADPKSEADKAEDHGLEDLGYLAVSQLREHEGKQGLTRNEADKVLPGYVLFNYCGWGPGLGRAPLDRAWGDTVLLGLDGKPLHTWNSDAFGRQRHGRSISRLWPDGSITYNVADTGMARVSWDGTVQWKLEGRYHHDHIYDEDGKIYALMERRTEVEVDGVSRRVLDHGIQIISAQGEVLDALWFSDVFATDEQYRRRLGRRDGREGYGDVFHANSVVRLGDHPDGKWSRGDFLVSLRTLNTVAVISAQSHQVLWAWGPSELQHQHSAAVTDAAHILAFDNGHRRRWSRVVEIDPATDEIVWSFRGTKADPFFSKTRGIVEPLPNGNVFVVSSNSGRIMEIERESNAVVWEFWTEEKWRDKVIPIRGTRLTGALAASVEDLLQRAPVPASGTVEAPVPASPSEDRVDSPSEPATPEQGESADDPDAEPSTDGA